MEQMKAMRAATAPQADFRGDPPSRGGYNQRYPHTVASTSNVAGAEAQGSTPEWGDTSAGDSLRGGPSIRGNPPRIRHVC